MYKLARYPRLYWLGSSTGTARQASPHTKQLVEEHVFCHDMSQRAIVLQCTAVDGAVLELVVSSPEFGNPTRSVADRSQLPRDTTPPSASSIGADSP